MRDGQVLAEGGEEVITEENLYSTYGTRFALAEVGGMKMAAPLS